MPGDKDARELKEILTIVSDKVPTLIKGIVQSIFSEESGREMGKAVGAFFTEVKKSDMPMEVAVELTRDYMGTFSRMAELFRDFQGSDDDEEFYDDDSDD